MAGRRSSGQNAVLWYTGGIAHVSVAFPEDRVRCSECKVFCRYEEAFRRYSCRATGEQLLYPFDTIGALCPIEFDQNQKDQEKQDYKEDDLPWHSS